jgi:hypothetical protein
MAVVANSEFDAMAFVDQTPQQQSAAAVDWLKAKGLPANAGNLNRAIGVLMGLPDQETQQPQAARGNPALERAITRTSAPRNVGKAANPAPTQVATRRAEDEPEVVHNPQEEAQEHGPARSEEMPPMPRMPGGRRAGTINGATRIDENNPEAGMHGGKPTRQADETGIDQMGLAIALGLPILGAVGAGSRALAGSAAEYVGRAPWRATGRVTDVPMPAIAAPTAQRMLPAPAANAGAALTGPSAPPMISGAGQAMLPAAPQNMVSSAPRMTAARLNTSERIPNGPRKNAQGTPPAQNTYKGQSPRIGEERPRGSTLRQQLMNRRSSAEAKRAARTGRE